MLDIEEWIPYLASLVKMPLEVRAWRIRDTLFLLSCCPINLLFTQLLYYLHTIIVWVFFVKVANFNNGTVYAPWNSCMNCWSVHFLLLFLHLAFLLLFLHLLVKECWSIEILDHCLIKQSSFIYSLWETNSTL